VSRRFIQRLLCATRRDASQRHAAFAPAASGRARRVPSSWARTNATLANGNNTYTAIAQDTYLRLSTNSITVNLPATNNYSYDLNGNLLSDGTRYFAYDDENQLMSVWVTNVWREDYVYDGLLRRRITRDYAWQSSSWLKTNEVRYVYDGQVVVQERDINNLPVVTYTRGNDLSGTLQGAGGIGGLLARTVNSQMLIGASFASAYYYCDGNGNISGLVYTNGLMAAQYTYDPFGNILTMSGPLASANTYRFSSKEWNDKPGTYYYGYRFYDPNVQRWLNRDLIEEAGGINLYAFVENNALSWCDLNGLCGGAFGNPVQYPNSDQGESGGGGNTKQPPANDKTMNNQLNSVGNAIGRDTSWPWSQTEAIQGPDADTRYHGYTDNMFRYSGNDYPGFKGVTMRGQDLNYIGVGYASAEAGLGRGIANYAALNHYESAHPNQNPSNAMLALNQGFNAYENRYMPCPDSFGTGQKSVAPPF